VSTPLLGVAQDGVIVGDEAYRALVEDSGHRARVYDARNRSWQDLGIVTQAESGMGRILKMALSADQKRASILASLAGELNVWMMPLPPRVPAPPPGK